MDGWKRLLPHFSPGRIAGCPVTRDVKLLGLYIITGRPSVGRQEALLGWRVDIDRGRIPPGSYGYWSLRMGRCWTRLRRYMGLGGLLRMKPACEITGTRCCLRLLLERRYGMCPASNRIGARCIVENRTCSRIRLGREWFRQFAELLHRRYKSTGRST